MTSFHFIRPKYFFMSTAKLIAASFIGVLFLASCSNNSSTEKTTGSGIKEENISYDADSAHMTGFVAWDSGSTVKRPVVLIVHEWWGLNDYVKNRARQIAALGYLAIAVDMYGDGKIGNNPDEARKLAMPFYEHPEKAKARFDAALAKIKTNALADTGQVAAMGYCFGGAIVLNMARMGERLKGVVSFHGNLAGVPADKNLLMAKILICHGDSDSFVNPEVPGFKKQMDSIGADYTFKTYPNATHAFTNPDATMLGEKFKMPIRYNAAADTASWKDMREFFGKIFK